MAASTAAYTVTTSAYTALSAGEAAVMLMAMNQGGVKGGIRLHLGTALPAADTEDWFPVESMKNFAFEGLSSTENVYARAMSANVTVRVMKR